MRSKGVILFFLVTVGCATSSDVDVPGNVTIPQVIHRVNPEYPAELRMQGVTGIVTVEATIDRTGQLLNPRVVRGSDPRLGNLALDAVRKWRFKPGTLNGEPVDVLFTVDVRFSIP